MRQKAENDLRILYENYGGVLLQKQEIEIEIRIRQGLLNLIAQDEQEKAREAEEAAKAEEEKAEDA